MTREDIVQSREYIFGDEACKHSRDQDAIQAFEDGAEYGYKFAVDKACEWLIKGGYFVNNTETIEDFKKAMEE